MSFSDSNPSNRPMVLKKWCRRCGWCWWWRDSDGWRCFGCGNRRAVTDLSLFATRDELAVEYAKLLNEKDSGWDGWPVLNLAIIDRWSVSGLRYVKTKAWKLALADGNPSSRPCNCDGDCETIGGCFYAVPNLSRIERALTEIAEREWRDEGGRIAAAIARDGLADRSPWA